MTAMQPKATKVVFRRFPDGEIIALFPDDPWNKSDYTTASLLAVGQHGAADYQHVVARPIRPPEP